MAEIKPFKALRYSSASNEELRDLIAPPYDVISKQKCAELHERNSKNVIQLILGDPSTCSEVELADPKRYQRPAALLKEWKKDGTLMIEKKPSLYVLEDRFRWGEQTLTRRGLILTVKLEEFGLGNIIPHEKTLATPIQDRFSLMSSTEIQESPIYMTVEDRDRTFHSLLEESVQAKPLWDFENRDEPIHHRLFQIDRDDWIASIQKALRSRPFLIADGHHRYQTALRFREKNGARLLESNFILALVAPTPDPGVVLTSIQRHFHSTIELASLLDQLRNDFTLKETSNSWEEFRKSSAAIGLLDAGKDVVHLLTPKTNEITVPSALLNEKIVKPILGIHLDNPADQKRVTYVKQVDELLPMVKQRSGFGFWLKPMSASEVMDVASRGEVLPQKSTFFYPKVMSGFVFHPLS